MNGSIDSPVVRGGGKCVFCFDDAVLGSAAASALLAVGAEICKVDVGDFSGENADKALSSHLDGADLYVISAEKNTVRNFLSVIGNSVIGNPVVGNAAEKNVFILSREPETYSDFGECGAAVVFPLPLDLPFFTEKAAEILSRKQHGDGEHLGEDAEQRAEPGRLALSSERQGVFVGEKFIGLSRLEFSLLEYLFSKRGEVVSADLLIREVWRGRPVSRGAVNVYVRYLREKLSSADGEGIRRIVSVRGKGYLLL